MTSDIVLKRIRTANVSDEYLVSKCGRFVWSERSNKFLKIDNDGLVMLATANDGPRKRFAVSSLLPTDKPPLPFVWIAVLMLCILAILSSDRQRNLSFKGEFIGALMKFPRLFG